MGARKPKPTQLKERTSVRPKLGLSRLFAAANALVPFHQYDEEQDAAAAAAKVKPNLRVATQASITNSEENAAFDAANEKTLHLELTRQQDAAKDTIFKPTKKPKFKDEESAYGTAVVVPNKTRRKPIEDSDTKTLKIPTGELSMALGVPATTSVTKLKKREVKAKEDQSKKFALITLVAAIALGTYALVSTPGPASTQLSPRKSALTPQQIEERLDYYRHTTGSKLNRERIDVQIQNFKQAPDLAITDHKVKPPSIMDGVPLQGEHMPFNRQPKPDLPYDPTYSEAKIGYGLQEEQDRQYFNKQAEEAWTQEFIENARKDGYDVKIDQFGNVKARAIPAEERGPVD